ncbi:hypothetical protein [Rugamonas rivuli]|uniref:Uncharacterized protein n=1 Tax=Rugamonas rivuli TaxID=2743358 RepID=A0A843SAM9_9BURK|nr:hypothetical protein [Rugamonas rivuli]MQA21279.1 hypothetical protein [Rugamonas rivuli]
MKHENISKPYFTQEQVDVAIAATPDHVDDPDCPCDPNNEAEVRTFWSKATMTFPDNHPRQKGPPFSPEEIETIVAAAPDYVDDPDCPYDQTNEAEVIAYWSKAKLVMPGEHQFQQNKDKKRS